ncbi:MAG: aminotransferase class III-fold pyridoxal phosphate-dependent enzyme, partial [Pseudomonadota bacterium]
MINQPIRDDILHPFSSVEQVLSQGPCVLDKAEGVRVWDVQGNEYIDTAASLWCVNAGYGRTPIIEAMTEQGHRMPFFHSFNGMANEPALQLTEKILSHAPDNIRKIFYGNSGSDGNDTAVKLIWLYNNLRGQPMRKKIIARQRGYHGVTVAAGSLTGLSGVHNHFDLPVDRFRHVSPPDLYRQPERDAQSYADELEDLIEKEGSDTIAAFFAEPVMGTGGVLPPPPGYYQAIKKVLDAHDILLVLDEVISGYGRLGHWFGAQRFDVEADLIITAKGLTSSYLPMSAVLLGSKVWDVIEAERKAVGVFGHGFTTSAHPIAAAVALANLTIIEDENLVSQAGEMGAILLSRMQSSLGNHPLVGDVRGDGLMVGVEIVADRAQKTSFDPALGVGVKIREVAMKNGLMVSALMNDTIAF